jgi:hypothetical protein
LPFLTRVRNWFTHARVLGGLTVTLVTALVFGFADPRFGFDLTSLRAVLAGGIALFVINYLANELTGQIAHRRWGLATAIRLKPLGLLLAVIGVIVSRLLDFSPGFLVGLTLGIVLGGSPSVSQRARTALIRAAFVFGFSVLAWLAYSALSSPTGPDSFNAALADDTFVAITTEGLTALLIGLLPFRFLEGETIFRESKFAWAASYFVAGSTFVAIVVPQSEGIAQMGSSMWVWFIGGFAVVAVGTYLYFRFWVQRTGEEEVEAPEEGADGTEGERNKVEAR